VTVINQNRAPTLNQPANMSVAQGFTSDQTIIGSDPDGDALTFAKVSGPTYMTVTTTNGTTGNIHLAAALAEPLGSSSASVSASDGSLSDTKSLTVTVTPTNHAPVLTQPANMTVNEGVTADQVLNATDSDANPLTFSKASGPTYATVTTTSPGTGAATGNLHLAPGFSDSGTSSVSILVSDGSLSDNKSLTVTVNNVNRPPTLTQPANMTVNEGATADQALLANDPDGDALTFAKVSGPTFETVVGSNVHLAPGFSDSGTYSSTVSVSDASSSDSKSFTITVNNVNRAPVLAQPANMTLNQGTTADQALSATDADGDALTFSLASGPTYASVTTTSPGTGTATGNIHLAPGSSDAGTASATVSVTDGVASNSKSLTITVGTVNHAPLLAQPGDVTVNEGMTADQALNATDPDGDALTFTKVTGPLFLTVTTVSPGTGTATGNAHLAPGFSDAGTYSAVVRATDPGSLSDSKSFNITVNNVNRAPVANPGGPYSGTVGVPVSFNGTGSSDPDGDALTYQWAFGDGSTGSGSSPTHTYLATGVYTDSLAVTDNGTPNLTSSTATTTTTITNELAATVFKSQVGIIKLKGGKPFYCYEVQPVAGDYANTDVILTTITMTFGGKTVSAEASRTSVDSDKNLDGIQEIKTCFSKANLQILFAGLPTGLDPVTLTIKGDLVTGGKFSGTVQDTVKVTGNGSAFEASVSPNPLNPQTTLHFTTSKPGTVRIEMFDLQGRLVRTIQSTTYMMTGDHELTIDGRGQSGEKLASGVYFIRGETADGIFKNMITILK
jgi:PKD repeat protein